MAVDSHSHDQPSRQGGVDHPTSAQLDGATADGAPTPAETGDPIEVALAQERDRNLRLRAELENVRGRTARELADQRKYAAMPLAQDLLNVLDNVDRAIASAEKNHDAGALLEGFKLVRQQLGGALAQHHCTVIPAGPGTEFDPQFHAAILQQPSAEIPAGHVTMVTQLGYQMHDRVVRPAQVIVSSGAAAAGS